LLRKIKTIIYYFKINLIERNENNRGSIDFCLH